MARSPSTTRRSSRSLTPSPSRKGWTLGHPEHPRTGEAPGLGPTSSGGLAPEASPVKSRSCRTCRASPDRPAHPFAGAASCRFPSRRAQAARRPHDTHQGFGGTTPLRLRIKSGHRIGQVEKIGRPGESSKRAILIRVFASVSGLVSAWQAVSTTDTRRKTQKRRG